jgi:hypothetical protein
MAGIAWLIVAKKLTADIPRRCHFQRRTFGRSVTSPSFSNSLLLLDFRLSPVCSFSSNKRLSRLLSNVGAPSLP